MFQVIGVPVSVQPPVTPKLNAVPLAPPRLGASKLGFDTGIIVAAAGIVSATSDMRSFRKSISSSAEFAEIVNRCGSYNGLVTARYIPLVTS
jgi:hypothetical protein